MSAKKNRNVSYKEGEKQKIGKKKTSNFCTATNSGAPVIRMKVATSFGEGVAIATQ